MTAFLYGLVLAFVAVVVALTVIALLIPKRGVR